MRTCLRRTPFLLLTLFAATAVHAQLLVAVSPPKMTANKAVVRLEIANRFTNKVESARASIFLLDDQGKMAGQATRWVIGGASPTATGTNATLPAGRTNIFHFVVSGDRPFTTTNLTPKVTFTRIVLADGTLADPTRTLIVPSAN